MWSSLAFSGCAPSHRGRDGAQIALAQTSENRLRLGARGYRPRRCARPRGITDPSEESSWFAERDPTGSIRADLERIGELDDGVFSTVDAG